MRKSYDVIIVGGGPVGLLLSCELALADVSVLVLEKDVKEDSLWRNGSLGMRGLNVPSVESFYRRGFFDKIFTENFRPIQAPKKDFHFAGHFAGMVLDGAKVDFSRWKYHLHGPAFGPGSAKIGHIEDVLSERAEELGVQILRQMEVTRLKEDDNGVTAWAGAAEESFTAKWLVGCDGGRSTVRKKMNFDFTGTEPQFTCYAIICELDCPEKLDAKTKFVPTDNGMYVKAPFGALYVMHYDTSFDKQTQELSKDHVEAMLQRVSGTDVRITELQFASSFTDRTKQASQYRKGRVLLAGDSAHIHAPVGSQGLNMGIGDTMNLGWKLAATVNGSAAPGLLDTYDGERRPLGATVLDWIRSQTVALRPDSHSRAVRQMMKDMTETEHGRHCLLERSWGLWQRYDLGETDEPIHELVGRSVPDFEFKDGERIGSKFDGTRFLYIDLQNDAAATASMFAKSLRKHVAYCSGQVKDAFGLAALLVRPDGIVSWVSEGSPDPAYLKVALSRWLKTDDCSATACEKSGVNKSIGVLSP